MTPHESDSGSRWRRVEAVFHRILDAEPSARAGRLAAEALDERTRAEVRSLLDAHEAAGSFLAGPAFSAAPDAADPVDTIPPGRERIGRCRLLRVLGRGGMGVVYEAEQDHPRRAVALKVLRRGGARDELESRLFRREIEALARLVHPRIARIHEAGLTPDGDGYFTMELVRGKRLDRWALEDSPPLAVRLQAFREICAAVAFAHLRGVIHCDLKPSNILVAGDREPAEIKVLDFGLARFAGPDAAETTPEHMQGSLAYMSPEQTRLRNVDIDLRADIYALGVILYEIVEGRRPYQTDGLPAPAAARVICDAVPLPLLDRTLPDLPAVVLRALAKDPADRYATAGEFAEDVRRILAGEPTAARPPGRAGQARRFVRRHRLGIGAASVLVLLLAAFAVASAVQASRFAAQRDEARRLQELSERVVEWWGGIVMGAAQPWNAADPAPAVKETLRLRAGDIDRTFAGEPRVQALLHHVFASTWRSLGESRAAVPHLERAASLREDALGRRHPLTLSALNNLAVARSDEGRFKDAEMLYGEVLDARRKTLPADDPLVLTSMHNLGAFLVQAGRFEAAEPLLREALEARHRALAPDDPDLQSSKKTLAGLLTHLGRYEEALPLVRESIDVLRRTHPGHHPNVLAATTTLARIDLQRGAWEECETIIGSAMAIAEEKLGARHEVTLGLLDVLSSLRARQGRLAEAAAAADRAYAGRRSALGPEHPETLVALRHRAMIWKSEGALDQAERAFRMIHEIQQRTLPPEHPSVLSIINLLYVLYADAGRWERAETLIEEAEADLAARLGPEHPNVVVLRSDLGRVALFRDDPARAERILSEALDVQRRIHGDEHERTLRTAGYVVELCRHQGRHDLAVELGGKNLEAIRRRLSGRHPEALAAQNSLALAHEDRKDWAAAEPLFAGLAEGMAETMPQEKGYRANALTHRGRCLRELGRHAEAEAVLLEAWRLLDGFPGQETIRTNTARQMMKLLEAAGRPEEALRYSADAGSDPDR